MNRVSHQEALDKVLARIRVLEGVVENLTAIAVAVLDHEKRLKKLEPSSKDREA